MKVENMKIGGSSLGISSLIATMPKSGTWYCHYFFAYYQQYLGNKTGEPEINLFPHEFSEINLETLFIAHAEFPGFFHYKGDYRKKWDHLKYHLNGYNWSQDIIRNNIEIFEPERNKNTKYIYLYRNPLDQIVSYFRHSKNHVQQEQKMNINKKGELVPFKNVSDFLQTIGLQSYIKQFTTYKLMENKYKDRLLMVTYEDLFKFPSMTFIRMLKFLNNVPEDEFFQNAFNSALSQSSMESLKKLENRIGRSLGNDQTDPNERHIRNGKIGKWRKYLSDKDLQFVDDQLSDFGLSLCNFTLI